MLSEIERQNDELRERREWLEADVAARTKELVTANEQLTLSVQRVESHVSQIMRLTEFGQLIQSCNSVEEVFNAVRHVMSRLFPEDSGAMSVLNPSGNVIEGVVAWGTSPPRNRVFEPDDCWAFRRGHPHTVSSPDSPLRCKHLAPHHGLHRAGGLSRPGLLLREPARRRRPRAVSGEEARSQPGGDRPGCGGRGAVGGLSGAPARRALGTGHNGCHDRRRPHAVTPVEADDDRAAPARRQGVLAG